MNDCMQVEWGRKTRQQQRTCSFCLLLTKVACSFEKSLEKLTELRKRWSRGIQHSCKHANLSNTTLLVVMLAWLHTIQRAHKWYQWYIVLGNSVYVHKRFPIDFVKQFIAETHELFSHTRSRAQTILCCR